MQDLQNQHSSDMHDIWHSPLEVKNAFAENSLRCLQNLWPNCMFTITHSKCLTFFKINVCIYIFSPTDSVCMVTR